MLDSGTSCHLHNNKGNRISYHHPASPRENLITLKSKISNRWGTRFELFDSLRTTYIAARGPQQFQLEVYSAAILQSYLLSWDTPGSSNLRCLSRFYSPFAGASCISIRYATCSSCVHPPSVPITCTRGPICRFHVSRADSFWEKPN